MASKTPSEDDIRDKLAENLDMIEPGLTLVSREHYLKNSDGAAGFLDILARSKTGQLVIIEIKKTKSASREAIQELFKYAALLRQRYLIRDVDFRLILLSVDWTDLSTPYSEFSKNISYEVSAGEIILGSDGLPSRVFSFQPLQTAGQRKLSTRHFLWHFATKSAADKAMKPLASHFQKAGLVDFVLVKSQSPVGAGEEMTSIYFAQQQLTLVEYQKLICAQLDDEAYKDYEAQIKDLIEEEDKISESADAVWYPGYDDLYDDLDTLTSEISHPEKASHWFVEGNYENLDIVRFGRFNDSGITDQTIISEIIGLGGNSDYRLDIKARTNSPPELAAMVAAIENVFFYNAEWRSAAKDLVGYARRSGNAEIRIIAFSNDDILRSIAGIAYDYPGYVPTFRIEISSSDGTEETFFGLPEWHGITPDFDRILTSYFGEDPFNYFMAYHFGEHRSVNVDIMNDLGMRYAVFRIGENGPERIRVQGSTVVASSNPVQGSIPSLIAANIEEVRKIVDLFLTYDQGFSQTVETWINTDINIAEHEVAEIASKHPQHDEKFYWSGDVENCELCDRDLISARFMIDSAVATGGPWACMCSVCFIGSGSTIGWGSGQLYARELRRWRLIAGGRPVDEADENLETP